MIRLGLPLALLPMLLGSGVSQAAGGGGHGIPHNWSTNVIFHAINLAILLFILVRSLRRPISDMLVRRQDTVRDQLERSELARREAEQRASAAEERLKSLSAELDTLHRETESAAREEAAQVVAAAQALAERLQRDNERILEGELLAARARMRREVVELATQLAEGLLREKIRDEDQVRLAESYVAQQAQSTEIH